MRRSKLIKQLFKCLRLITPNSPLQQGFLVSSLTNTWGGIPLDVPFTTTSSKKSPLSQWSKERSTLRTSTFPRSRCSQTTDVQDREFDHSEIIFLKHNPTRRLLITVQTRLLRTSSSFRIRPPHLVFLLIDFPSPSLPQHNTRP